MNPAKVMIVEDDSETQRVLAEALTEENCETNLVKNGHEALTELRAGRKLDLIFLDLLMPVMNGWEILTAWQKDPAFAKIPVVVLSSVANKETAYGATDFLKKPVDLDSLVNKVRQFCHTDKTAGDEKESP